MKYAFPAIFTPDASGFSVRFPDIANCVTSGKDTVEALDMAQDVLNLTLWDMEEDGREIKRPSAPSALSVGPGEFVTLIAADTDAYRRRHDTRSVKKTLTIPSWLNTAAEEQHINFSSVLQKALRQRLNIE